MLAESLVFNRMQGWLFSIFAVIALVLALTGIYGVLSQEVSLQTRDIGLRMALGASRPDIVRLVLTPRGAADVGGRGDWSGGKRRLATAAGQRRAGRGGSRCDGDCATRLGTRRDWA